MLKTCGYLLCKKEFKTRQSKRKFCCRECYIEYRKIYGSKGDYRPGTKPWNKGLKGIHLSPRTEFKPGNNMKALGSFSLKKRKGNPRRYIKIMVGEQPKWVLYSKYLWEKTHGKIPLGYTLLYKDGDILNDEISNLGLVSISDMLLTHKRQKRSKRQQASLSGEYFNFDRSYYNF
jgi:hypothetical protein